jgi:hypothetical protein
VIHLRKAPQVVGWAGVLALLAPIGFLSQSRAQETKVSHEGGSWAQEVTGSLAAVRNLRVKVDMGSVVVRGGQQQGIHYVFHTRYGTSSEQEARRQFEQYKVTAYVKGDTAWIVGDWQGGRHPRHFSGEFSVMVPRDMALVKLVWPAASRRRAAVEACISTTSAEVRPRKPVVARLRSEP